MRNLTCPVCRGSLREVIREGILIDICTQCHGIWLDRGELDKLIVLSQVDNDIPLPPPSYPQPGYHRNDRDDDDDRRRHAAQGQYEQYGRKRKKKGFDFGDIFDFGD